MKGKLSRKPRLLNGKVASGEGVTYVERGLWGYKRGTSDHCVYYLCLSSTTVYLQKYNITSRKRKTPRTL